MGWDTCSDCGGGFEDMITGCCENHYDEGKHFCDRCNENMERENCGKCGSNFCENHGDHAGCCDQYLCESCNTEDVGDEVHGKTECDQCLCESCSTEDVGDDVHGKTESCTTCRHWKCNYYNGPGDCFECNYKCEYEESRKKQCIENGLERRDEPLANTLLKNCKSDSLKECLRSWLKTVPPENNSRKRDGVVDEDDVVDSAKSNKKSKVDADVEIIVVD